VVGCNITSDYSNAGVRLHNPFVIVDVHCVRLGDYRAIHLCRDLAERHDTYTFVTDQEWLVTCAWCIGTEVLGNKSEQTSLKLTAVLTGLLKFLLFLTSIFPFLLSC